jgi:hypothetical protein
VIFISKYFFRSTIFLVVLTLFICIFFIPLISNSNNLNSFPNNYGEILDFSSNGFAWPIPGYTRISSPFGKRDSPTTRCF